MTKLGKAQKFVLENPVTAKEHGLDEAVRLALAAQDTLDWLEKALGRAKAGRRVSAVTQGAIDRLRGA